MKKIITNREWFEIFPEAIKEYILPKIIELGKNEKDIKYSIKNKLMIIEDKSSSDSKWFWREVVKVWEGWDLLEVKKQLLNLKYLILSMKSETIDKKRTINEELIRKSESIPIEMVVGKQIELTRRGKNLIACCPFHIDKNPSFYVYPETNSFYCFSCGAGGNVITFVMKYYNVDFKTAIKYLN